MNMNYGEEVNLTKSEKKMHTYKVLHEWPSAVEQLHFGQIYNSEKGIHLGDKLWKNQQYSALNVYKKLVAKSGAILENILKRDGSFDEFSNEISARFPLFLHNSLETIEKKLVHAAKNHYSI